MMNLSPPEHEHSAAIDVAATWLATTPRHARGDRPIVPLLRERTRVAAATTCNLLAEFKG